MFGFVIFNSVTLVSRCCRNWSNAARSTVLPSNSGDEGLLTSRFTCEASNFHATTRVKIRYTAYVVMHRQLAMQNLQVIEKRLLAGSY